MGYAVELYFDAQAEHHLRQLRKTLAEHGIPPLLDEMGARPHVSLACFTDANAESLLDAVAEFAPTINPFPLTLASIGAFPTSEGVVFLGPTPTEQLLALHRAFHASLEAGSLVADDYYLPDRWVPHCTTAMDLTPKQVATAAEICMTTFQPLPVMCQQIGILTFRPFQTLATFPLGEVEEEVMGPATEAFWHDYLDTLPADAAEDASRRFYEAFSIGGSGESADEGAALIAQGVKTATSALLWEYDETSAPLQQVGSLSIVEDGSGEPVCIVETTWLEIIPFDDVDEQLAHDYGEWDRTLESWRRECWDYYAAECRSLGREPSPEMPLVCERFRVVHAKESDDDA